jgi:WD40 repeat protein
LANALRGLQLAMMRRIIGWTLSNLGPPAWTGRRDEQELGEPNGRPIMSAGRSLALLAVLVSTWQLSSADAPLPAGARLRLGPNREWLYQVPFMTWAPDGALIVTAATDHSIRLWDAGSGREVRRIMVPDHLWCGESAAAFAPNGKALIAHGVRVDLAGDKGPTAFGCSRAFAASPDGQVLAVAAGGGKVHLWDRTTTQFLGQLAPEGGATAGPMTFSPDGRILAIGQEGAASVELWDVTEHKLLKQFRPEVTAPSLLAFTPDGGSLLVVSSLPFVPVEVWDVSSARLLRRLHATAEKDRYHCPRAAALSPDGQLLALDDKEDTVEVYELFSEQLLCRFRGDSGRVRALAFAPNGKNLLSSGDDGVAFLWRLGLDDLGTAPLSPRETARLWQDLQKNALPALMAQHRLAVAPDIAVPALREWLRPEVVVVPAARIAQLVRQLEDDKFSLREAATEELQRLGERARASLEASLKGESSPELRRRARSLLAALDNTNPEWLREYRAIQALGMMKAPQADALLRALAAGGAGGFRTRTAAAVLTARERPPAGPPPAEPVRVPTRMMYAHLDEVSGVAFSPDGKLLVSTGRDGAVRRWDIGKRKELPLIRAHFGGANALAFTPNGRLLTAGEDKTVRAWDLVRGKEVACFKGHTGSVFSLAVSGDGK